RLWVRLHPIEIAGNEVVLAPAARREGRSRRRIQRRIEPENLGAASGETTRVDENGGLVERPAPVEMTRAHHDAGAGKRRVDDPDPCVEDGLLSRVAIAIEIDGDDLRRAADTRVHQRELVVRGVAEAADRE